MHVLDAVFAWVMAASLRASLLTIAVFALQFALGRRISARCRYALWLPVVLVVIMPVLPPSPWSVENRLALLSTASPPSASASLCTNLAVTMTRVSSIPSLIAKWPALLAAWFCVASALMVIAGVGYRRTLERITRSTVTPEPELLDDIAAVTRQVRLRRPPQVIVAGSVESPAVTGLFRSLLLPAGFPEGFTRTESRLILFHEFTHLRRFDLLLNWFLCVLQAVHWFNPLLWFALGRLRADREAACDAQVLSAHREDLRADYAHALLKLHQATSPTGLSLAFGGISTRDSLRFRLFAITRHRRTHPAWSAVGAVMIAWLVLAGATRAPSNAGVPPNADISASERQGGKQHRLAITPSDSLSGVVSDGLIVQTGQPPANPNVVSELLTEQAEVGALFSEHVRSPRGRGKFREETRDSQSLSKSEPAPSNALPEWWPAATSARIMFNSGLRHRGPFDWKSHRTFAESAPNIRGAS